MATQEGRAGKEGKQKKQMNKKDKTEINLCKSGAKQWFKEGKGTKKKEVSRYIMYRYQLPIMTVF